MSIFSHIDGVYAVYETEDETYAWRGEPSASVTLLCDWNKRYNVVTDLLGYGRKLPRRHPNAKNYKVTEDQAFEGIYVKSVSIKGIGKPTQDEQENDYEKAELTVSYQMLPQRTYSENITYEVQNMTLPAYMFKWDANTPVANGEEPTKPFRTQKITHSYTIVKEIPQWVGDDIGKVNSDTVTTSQGWTCAPGTLLYGGSDTSITWEFSGNQGWTLNTNWSYNPFGWNKWFNTVQQQWMTIKKIGVQNGQEVLTDYNIYASTTFSGKFDFEPEDLEELLDDQDENEWIIQGNDPLDNPVNGNNNQNQGN